MKTATKPGRRNRSARAACRARVRRWAPTVTIIQATDATAARSPRTATILQEKAVVGAPPIRRLPPFWSGRARTSRFDTGGVENPVSAQQVSSYLFSDRGIYRPAETMHLGLITRSADWKSALTGLPLTVEITDPRGLVVKSDKVMVSAGAFDELTYEPPASAPTGTYEAVAYLVKDPRRRERSEHDLRVQNSSRIA